MLPPRKVSPHARGCFSACALLLVLVSIGHLCLVHVWELGSETKIMRLASIAFLLIGLCSGAVRLLGTHPSTYWKWLNTTPWSPGDPLPFESPLLYWRDLLRIGILFCLGAVCGCGSIAVVAYGAGYLAATVYLLAKSEPRRYFHAVVSIVAISLLVFSNPLPIGVGAITALIIGQLALRETLLRPRHIDLVPPKNPKRRLPMLGNPFSPLGGQQLETVRFSLIGAVTAALCTAAVVRWFVLTSQNQDSVVALVGVGTVGLLALSRISQYWNCHRSPISLLGRLRTGRLIVPGYDRYMLPSLWALLAAGAISGMGIAINFPGQYLAIITAFVGSFLVFALRPTLPEWNLTGQHSEPRDFRSKNTNSSNALKRL